MTKRLQKAPKSIGDNSGYLRGMQDDATKERRISKNLGLSQLKNATVKPQILQESQEAGTPHHEMLPEEEVDGELWVAAEVVVQDSGWFLWV